MTSTETLTVRLTVTAIGDILASTYGKAKSRPAAERHARSAIAGTEIANNRGNVALTPASIQPTLEWYTSRQAELIDKKPKTYAERGCMVAAGKAIAQLSAAIDAPAPPVVKVVQESAKPKRVKEPKRAKEVDTEKAAAIVEAEAVIAASERGDLDVGSDEVQAALETRNNAMASAQHDNS